MQQRVIIIVLALMVSLPFVLKSRVSGISNSCPAVFSVSTSCKVMVRVSGDVRHSGIYEVGANALTGSVINMAGINGSLKSLTPSESVARTVVNGADLNLKMQNDGTGILSVGSMPSGERIVMGIPLDINFMDEADFRRLPGIGPVMASRIIEYRQKNGGKMMVEDLIAVEGIGEKRYQKLSKYF